MRKIFLLLLSACFTTILLAQKNGSVKGIAFDIISKQPVAAATVTVLERKDSSLVTFTMTGDDGQFQINGLAKGEYRLMISHVNYHNSNRFFSVTETAKNAELGNVTMNDKVKVLEEVVLASEAPPVTLINDTIQYNAGSFKVQPNASVEQLLKKLPGVKVEKDGTIKAQGQNVTKVLVDGKEFFGNDPKIATKNLPADAVDKVQVYDKQSDQAQLTGFEDGNYEKTINLQTGVRKTKPVNVDGIYNINSNISYSMPVRFLKGTIELSSGAGYNSGKQLVNNQAGNIVTNAIKTLTLGQELRLDMNPTDKLNVGVGVGYNYNKTKYSLQFASDNNYFHRSIIHQ
ncbi:MAG: carboxypeptidase-like regulatory domain-containing protein [Chitinophagaceae bacterium]|nr:carboxypeptidase-like regulatory domain-containing protein [Chitinophagaceae bacterium]